MENSRSTTTIGRQMERRRNAIFFAVTTSLSLSISSNVLAQQSNLVSPNDRVPEGYRPLPIYLNSFELSPSISLDASYVDNIFVTDDNKLSDSVLSINPRLYVRDRRQDREIALRLGAGIETYLENNVDDRVTADVAGSARFGLGTLMRTFAGANFRRNGIQGQGISDFGTTGQPLTLTSFGGNLGVERDMGPVTATIEGKYRSTSFGGGIVIGGDLFESGFRDYETLTGRARLSYSVSPAQRIYAEVVYSDRSFDEPTAESNLPASLLLDRSSDDVSLLLGFTRQLTNVLQLDVNAGYIDHSFDNDTFSNSSGHTFNGSLNWDPTRLTRVQLRGTRSIDSAYDPLFDGFLRTEGSLRVSHELRRNFILDGNVRYASINVLGGRENGSQFATHASAKYLLSKNWSLKLRGEYFEQESTFFPGTQTRVTIGTQYSF